MVHPTPPASTRRALLGAGITLPVLAACGSGSDDSSGSSSASSPSDAASSPSDAASSPSGGGEASGGIPTSDVPVGGGAIFEDTETVVTQPAEGEFKAFSSICTHQGCPVAEVTEEGIVCNCHGSIFSLEDGSPTAGPASDPLPEKTVTVEGDSLTIS